MPTSCAVTVQLISTFAFTYAIRFSHDPAQMQVLNICCTVTILGFQTDRLWHNADTNQGLSCLAFNRHLFFFFLKILFGKTPLNFRVITANNLGVR